MEKITCNEIEQILVYHTHVFSSRALSMRFKNYRATDIEKYTISSLEKKSNYTKFHVNIHRI